MASRSRVRTALLTAGVTAAGLTGGLVALNAAGAGSVEPGCCSFTGARAQASVKPSGSSSRKKNVTTITRPGAGRYCLVLDPVVTIGNAIPVVAFDLAATPGNTVPVDVAVAVAPQPECPTNSFEVFTRTVVGGNLVPTDLGFTFLVP